MIRSIKVVITIDGSSDNDNVINGNYIKDMLYINISYLPEEIHILIREFISANKAERCLDLLREKLCNCEALIINEQIMKYHNHSQIYCLFGSLIHETENECIKEIHYHITYSLHDLS